ncbi:hypothetical protein [Priestia megaterium]|uniref:hypothetical protein n=1 Tax=Priestia megaterium TaxID=1404 RepID=UPI000BFBACDC|nr:hypothetical protein [Priestia megaterium]PGR08514.1 hypothetical protein COA23_09030 [Priestia megaterium]
MNEKDMVGTTISLAELAETAEFKNHSANVDACEIELFETYWKSVCERGYLSEGQWGHACYVCRKYFDFTNEQRDMYTAISETYCSTVEEGAIKTEDGTEVFKAVQDFVHLFCYFIRDDVLVNGTQA